MQKHAVKSVRECLLQCIVGVVEGYNRRLCRSDLIVPYKDVWIQKLIITGKDSVRVSKHNADAQKRSSKARSLTLEDEDWIWTANKKTPLITGSNLTRSGSVKDLIYRFDGPPTPPRLGSLKIKQQDVSARDSGKMRHESRERGKNQNPVSGEPSEPETQESSEQKRHSAEKKKKSDDKQTSRRSKDKAAVSDPGPHSSLYGEKQHSGPQSKEEPTTPKIRPNPKYQLYLGYNGTSGSNGSVGDGGGSHGNLLRVSSVIRGSMESLSSRDWDSMSDRTGGFESPPRVFNSPYSTLSLDYNPINRMSDFKTQEVMSPAGSEMSLFGLNRSVSPVSSPAVNHRTRVPGYDSLTRRRDVSLRHREAGNTYSSIK
ncbi:uncharacterized protein LOC107677855 [Sinocyclocheilus anshuiensis]|uniref:uncharacterized protein LOC107677855 n=1 Tax=Sinocyclocheilus anshuiensis TaxID=1608454 RepID=UPI0007B92926|nr:PREDICTED: uncharacterized protein LOC107677855 [Sinocyclocheilus anshuiensis]